MKRDRPIIVIAGGVDYYCSKCEGYCKLPPGHFHVEYVDGRLLADMSRYTPPRR